MAAPEWHMRRRTRLAGLQRPRAASIQLLIQAWKVPFCHRRAVLLLLYCMSRRPAMHSARGAQPEMECPDLLQRIRACLLINVARVPPQNQRCLSRIFTRSSRLLAP